MEKKISFLLAKLFHEPVAFRSTHFMWFCVSACYDSCGNLEASHGVTLSPVTVNLISLSATMHCDILSKRRGQVQGRLKYVSSIRWSIIICTFLKGGINFSYQNQIQALNQLNDVKSNPIKRYFFKLLENNFKTSEKTVNMYIIIYKLESFGIIDD